jgi:predicted dehydrogenase
VAINPKIYYGPLKILVCGLGSIGKRHIENLVSLGASVSSWTHRPPNIDQLSFLSRFDISYFENIEDAIQNASGIVIATPTDTHIPIGNLAVKYNKHVYFEKPISNEAFDPKHYLSRNQLVIEVGCQLRSHPCLIKLKDLLGACTATAAYRFSMGYRLDLWRPDSDYRASFSCDSNRGGGPLFELVHMIDLSIWLFGPVKYVYCQQAKRSMLELKCNDMCMLTLEHEAGVIGQVQLDMLSPIYRCDLEIVQLDSVYNFNLPAGTLDKLSADSSRIQIASTPSDFSRNALFVITLRNFLDRIISISNSVNTNPLCSFEDAYRALMVLLAADLSASTAKQTIVHPC